MNGNGEAVTRRTETRSGEGSAFILSRGVLTVFAVACGAAVANVYFAQPLLVTMGHDLAMSPALVGSVVTLTHVGYGLGLFFLVPLGDVTDRRRLIVAQLLLLVAALTVVATAHTAAIVLAGMAATGLLAVVTQTLVAFAASLASPTGRGRVVGLVTSGVVVGILDRQRHRRPRRDHPLHGGWLGHHMRPGRRLQLPRTRPVGGHPPPHPGPADKVNSHSET